MDLLTSHDDIRNKFYLFNILLLNGRSGKGVAFLGIQQSEGCPFFAISVEGSLAEDGAL